jgi:hypothetical protein
LLELDQRLRAAPGDAARERLLAALQSDLENAVLTNADAPGRSAPRSPRSLEHSS